MTTAASPPETAALAAMPWWRRAHRALMPDYNRKATAYWWLMVTIGAAVLSYAFWQLSTQPALDWLQIAAGTAIAMAAGFFPVRVPRSKNSFAAGEIFIFLLLLLHGPAAATVATAGEALIGSWRTSKRWTSRIVSPAMACTAMFCAGSLLHAAIAAARAHGSYGAGMLLSATVLAGALHFVLNTVAITAVPYLKREQWPTFKELFGSFGWVGATFAGSAAVACLLFVAFERAGSGVLVAATPIIAMLLAVLHYHFRHQEADERGRQAQLQAVEREAELARRHMQALEVSERRFHSAFTHASIGMALVSFDGRILQANPALRGLLGLTDDAPGQRFTEFVGADHRVALNEQLLQMTAEHISSFSLEIELRHAAGNPVWAAVHASFFSELEAGTRSLILQVQDVTARRQAEAGLQQIAFHDSLTGLPNRRRFQDELERALERVKADPQRHFGLMFLDFDRFKLINDSLGHAVGDEFLAMAARRIQGNLRPQDFCARLGGDEFAILAENLDCEGYAVKLAERLIESLNQPFQIAGIEITSSASVGITFSGMGYTTAAEMLRDADTAMYKAKHAGKARYALFDSALHTEVSHRLRLEGDLRRALAAGQIGVAYQPIYELTAGRILGFEALARWNHPELGAVSPATFIGVAEDAGLILQVTDFVLRSACRQLKAWQLRDPSLGELKMHVNVSGNDIAHGAFVSRVSAALADAGLQPQHLTLELTENILMERLESAMPTLTELCRIGVALSVDDFGAGYSSLRHLSKLPVQNLKIDRAFVADLQWGSDEAAVVGAIVMLGKSLGKGIIAEGIETPAQARQLRAMGCANGQGFHLSRPLTVARVDEMLDGLIAAGVPPALADAAGRQAVLH